MRVYGMTLTAVMEMPMKVFWHLSGSVPRLIAEEQRDLLELLVAAGQGNATRYEEIRKALDRITPNPVKYSGEALMQQHAERDEVGFAQLRGMAG